MLDVHLLTFSSLPHKIYLTITSFAYTRYLTRSVFFLMEQRFIKKKLEQFFLL